MMPASRAVPSTSPFLASPWRISASVSGCITTQPSAIAARAVVVLVRDVDHVGGAGRVEMGEVGSCAPRRTGGAGSRPRRRPAASGSRRRGRCGCRPAASRAMSAGVTMPLSPTTMRSRRDERRQLLAHGERHLEGAQVAVVDADELACRAAAPGRARRRSWTSTSTSMPSPCAVSIERARLRVGDARHDDEDAVGAPGARLEDLVGLEQEVLAQGRQAGGLARLRRDIRAGPGTRARR